MPNPPGFLDSGDVRRLKRSLDITAFYEFPTTFLPTYVTSGDGPPAFTPNTTEAIYFDRLNSGKQYNFWGGTWH